LVDGFCSFTDILLLIIMDEIDKMSQKEFREENASDIYNVCISFVNIVCTFENCCDCPPGVHCLLCDLALQELV